MMFPGYIIKVDKLGGVVIPKDLRNAFSINSRDYLEVFVDDSAVKRRVIIKKSSLGCIICGELQNCVPIKDQWVCRKCIAEILNSPAALPCGSKRKS